MAFDTDVAIVGSGFGGSVSALRLTEKGYRVTVLEAGKRWTKDTLPDTNWNLRRYVWAPRLGLRGFQRLTLLKDVFVLSGAAVGGGSVVYANTLYEPLDAYWRDHLWPAGNDWRSEYAPYYDQAKRMLGVTPVPFITPADRLLKAVAEDMGVADTYHPTDVGVWFGKPGERVSDPYFGGLGPDRVGCIRCGNCMVGCKHEAKNSLDHNYLHLAEQAGTEVLAERQVVDVLPLRGGGWRIVHERPGAWFRKDRQSLTTEQVILSGGALGTQRLLFELKERGRLPGLSPALGTLVRTNSEALVGATAHRLPSGEVDPTPGSAGTVGYASGVAITSSIHPDEDTHIEPVRYGKGSNAMALIATLMVDGGGRLPRPLRFLLAILRHPLRFLRSLSARSWSERTVILLTMQTIDNSLRMVRKRGPFGPRLTTRQGHGEPNPTWIPAANRAARHAAEHMDGEPMGSIFEATLNTPATAHFIGGCPLGEDPSTSVVDPYHRVHGVEGLHVCDGSTITSNLGVNPSLTITAMTERAMALWPNRGEADRRPPMGAAYERLAPVKPERPVVPSSAPAALRLPVVEVATPPPSTPPPRSRSRSG
ncbi:MAG: GMC family oxidoreductase [Nitriliruptor sp.]|nr:MAG: GMC family oxidoreductase [Nitriliruptor sp.]